MNRDISEAFGPPPPEALRLFTPRQVAKLCAVSDSTVYRAIRNGELDAFKLERGPLSGTRVRWMAVYDWQTRGLPSGAAPRAANGPFHSGESYDEGDAA